VIGGVVYNIAVSCDKSIFHQVHQKYSRRSILCVKM
jgi:hypothetical protein